MTWWMYALLAAVFASFTAVLAKIGIAGTPSNLAAAIRTVIVVVFAWGMTFFTGEHRQLANIEPRSLMFLLLSGLTTGASWLAYFKALQMGPASRVAPIDKVSLAFTIILAVVFLNEPLTWKVAGGAALIIAGALLTIA